MTLKRIGDSNAVASCLFTLAATAANSSSPSFLQALLSGKSFKGSSAPSKEDQIENLDLAGLAEELDATGSLKSADAVPFSNLVDRSSEGAKPKLQLIGVTWMLVIVSVFACRLANVLDLATPTLSCRARSAWEL